MSADKSDVALLHLSAKTELYDRGGERGRATSKADPERSQHGTSTRAPACAPRPVKF
jgi:hypothetical protein